MLPPFRNGQEPNHRDDTPGCVVLPKNHPMTEEPNSLPHTPYSTSSARLFGRHGGILSLPQSDRNPSLYVPFAGEGNRADASRKWTQMDQDVIDERARKKAMSELVQSWMDRLHLISVITTFFAAMEASLLGSAKPNDPVQDPPVDQLANAALTGALVVHVFAAILSFLAAFFLIRYKLIVAKREERKVESGLADAARTSEVPSIAADSDALPIFSSDPHLEQVGPFRRGRPPTHLLDDCHSLCMWLAAVGFVLALVGVLAFAWAKLATSSGIFATICVVVCLASSVSAIFWQPASPAHCAL
ncbi:hypothetical protein GY45DRAFT_1317414 [Cubamyces sp. BRFM 1775]|nr:hypothetical protein GY45DRAFT_1317414 [Cubamyces sp. BRFM 1775]